MKLVEDWKKAHKWLSMQLSIIGLVATGLWDYLPELQSALPPSLLTKITMILFMLIGIGRLIKQEKDNAGAS